MKYIVIELQTDSNSNVANIVSKYDTANEAESKFHTILAAAAVSNVPVHAAIMMTNFGDSLGAKYYIHGEGLEE